MGGNCRICGSNCISDGKQFSPYSNFDTTYYDCNECGCRFVSRDEFIYEQLHAADSTYSAHRELSNNAKKLFDQSDVSGLASYLSQTPKNEVIVKHLINTPNCERVLEFGCSRGYLSSYAILIGKEFYGVDISETAIAAAKDIFGDHFLLENEVDSLSNSKFDFIYHVGTIGCVDNPIEFLKHQISMLRPQGSLIFNAPNLDACRALKLDWLLGTTPPDLVTLFPPAFWKLQFSDIAQVDVKVTLDNPLQSFLRQRRATQHSLTKPKELFKPSGNRQERSFIIAKSRQILKTLGGLIPPIGPFSRLPQEFGVYVHLVAR